MRPYENKSLRSTNSQNQQMNNNGSNNSFSQPKGQYDDIGSNAKAGNLGSQS